ncbi:META domain-containing protein [Pseudoalteromonas sp. MMG007]|uniref:META domain-containing protein n=1 Tax=Pseudoalteromonas sp. MMG007 TaxID=2822684 RepID=UPI001B393367|nr:META domain-containing protein [Pseudoalteromonas sp. MMG007]MBQ4856565.1 META domain-containing protein [Pseudoalteromonas sp. MMG007]
MTKHQAVFSRKKTLTGLSILALSAFTLTGCDQQTTHTEKAEQAESVSSLTTLVTYKDRSMLRPDSQLIVTLSDVSKMDVKADIIAQEVIDITQAPPFTVEMVYDADKINDQDSYNLTARIINKDNVLYKSDAQYNPFKSTLSGVPHEIEVVRVKVQKPNVTLANTYWKAVTVNAKAVSVKTKEPFIKFDKDNRVNGFLGCNNFSGSYNTKQQSISFSQLASTKKMCSENMDQEAAMSDVLSKAKKWEITGESLKLKDTNASTLATFNAVYFN